MTVDDFIHKAADQPLEPSDVDRVCSDQRLSVGEVFDEVSRRIARRYASGELDFPFCDSVVNRVYSYMLHKHDQQPPPYSLSVFLAFDAGEYYHSDDPPGASPEELYTKPMIAKILASDSQVT